MRTVNTDHKLKEDVPDLEMRWKKVKLTLSIFQFKFPRHINHPKS